jgi:autotransporter-associated beta strand protein
MLLSAFAPLQAATTTNWLAQWDNWTTPKSWDAGVPSRSTYANISNNGTATINTNGAICYSLYLGNYYNSQTGNVNMTSGTLEAVYSLLVDNGTFTQSGGRTTVDDNVFFLGMSSGSTGTYNLGGTAQLVAYSLNIAVDGTGNFNQTGGTNSVSHGMYIGYGKGIGTYTQSGGAVAVTETIWIGCNGGKGAYILQGDGQVSAYSEEVGNAYNGTFTQSSGTNTTYCLAIGSLSNSTSDSGKYFLSGGVLAATQEVLGAYISHLLGNGTFTQTGGTHIVSNSLTLSPESKGNATYNLEGGTLVTPSIVKGSGNALFNFGNGTLKANGSLSTSMPMTLTGKNGSANIDTTNGNITLSGILSGPGGLNKIGDGMLALLAANTYNGDTSVDGGTLSINVNCLSDGAGVHISTGANLNLTFSGTDTVGLLYLDGLPVSPGTWGSSQSGATHIDNVHFSGTGMLNVLAVPEPSTIALLLTASIGGLLWWRRRS